MGSTCTVGLRGVASALVVAAASAGIAPAQTTIFSNSQSQVISVDGPYVFFVTPLIELCNYQQVRRIGVAGGAATGLLTFNGTCPVDDDLMKADGTSVFLASGGALTKVWSGGVSAALTPVNPSSTASQTLDTSGNWVYWSSSTAVGRVGRDGATPTQVARTFTTRRGMCADASGFAYYVEGGEGAGVIKRADLSVPSSSVFAGGTFNSPTHLDTDATHLYWAETNGVIKRTTLIPGGVVTTLRPAAAGFFVTGLVVDATHVYWTEVSGAGRIMKVPLGGGTAVQVGAGSLSNPTSLCQDTAQLYWLDGTNRDIKRVRKDAAAVTPDFSWIALEATQGIQNLANGVPVIQGKPTLVRGYARSSSAGYPYVSARLHGVRTSNGAALPGSPLRSTLSSMTVPTDATVSDARRRNLASTFNWEIPKSWLDHPFTLTAEVNGEGAITETATANNTTSRSLQVRSGGSLHLELRRTRTGSGIYEPSGAGYWAVLNRFRSLFPMSHMVTYPLPGVFEEPDCCVASLNPFYWGEWEVADSWDASEMIFWLIAETSTSWGECGDSCQTHRVAMIHPGEMTGGLANFVWNVSWVTFYDSPRNTFSQPAGGPILAQEVGHNYQDGVSAGRWGHVDCGNPDGINTAYPYATNTIGPIGAAEYYGYDFITRTVIHPAGAKDYMSYCGPQWTSDYNWRGVLDKIDGAPVPFGPPPAQVDYLLAIGFFDHDQESAEIRQIIRFPTALTPADHVNRMLAQQAASTSANPLYRLELRSSTGAALQAINFDSTIGSPEHVHDREIFAVLIPDHPQAASVLVKRRSNSVTIGSRSASANPPVISAITSPSSGQTINNSLTISWTASDPDGDPLTYIVQYSRDNGATWQNITANAGSTSISVSALQYLPGSTTTFPPGTSRVRVIASDGFHSTVRTSSTFLVTDRDPIAGIMLPMPDAHYAAGESIRFAGNGWDPELGELTGSATWVINGSQVANGYDAILTDGLAPGTYTVTLNALASLFSVGSASVTFHVDDVTTPVPDRDGDGIPDSIDNCPFAANASQLDTDGDGFGDVCDNCPLIANSEQGDINGNGVGNSCDVSRLYVNAGATGANNGLSWASAFTTLEAALIACDTYTHVSEIWIAQGRYVPTARTIAPDARSATFVLRPDVAVLGGFEGTETEAHDADPAAHPTVLSGDLADNDGPNFTNRAENAYTVVTCNLNAHCDGLVISGGNASDAPTSVGGGANISTASSASVVFDRCDFISNQGGPTSGGGASLSTTSPGTFMNCRFLGNTTAGLGGGVRVKGQLADFRNCVFVGNSATGGTGARGGAVASESASLSFLNCTLAGNTSTGLAGALFAQGPGSRSVGIVNSIFYFNSDPSGSGAGAQITTSSPGSVSVTVTRSCMQGGFAGSNIAVDPMFNDLDGPDNVIGTTDDNARPMQSSPVNDAGANSFAASLSLDLDGSPRMSNDPAEGDTGWGGVPVVDMGAYEFQGGAPCPSDFNGAGGVTVADIFAFLSAWFSGNLAADFNGTGGLTVADIFAFLTQWFSGC